MCIRDRTLCITMTGVMSFWMGLMRIAERGGVIAGLSRKLKPVLRFLFPQIPPGHVANEQIAANMIANIFVLGWAATPAGLKAMESLEELEESRRKEMGTENGAAKRKKGHQTKPAPVPRGTANAEMCTFLIMNISSMQLIPVNIIAFRSQYGLSLIHISGRLERRYQYKHNFYRGRRRAVCKNDPA